MIDFALGVNMEDTKELLGMWISENKSSKFCLKIVTEFQNRSIKDILIVGIDSLKGFIDEINIIFKLTLFLLP